MVPFYAISAVSAEEIRCNATKAKVAKRRVDIAIQVDERTAIRASDGTDFRQQKAAIVVRKQKMFATGAVSYARVFY